MKSSYMIDGYNDTYDTLRDVREHVYNQSEKDKHGYNGVGVWKVGDESFYREIVVKPNGKVILGKGINRQFMNYLKSTGNNK